VTTAEESPQGLRGISSPSYFIKNIQFENIDRKNMAQLQQQQQDTEFSFRDNY
jgi:hypothetical protein